MTEKIYRAWHVCPADMMTVYRPDRPRIHVVEGETLTMHENDRLRPCVGADGLHGAVLLLDALKQRNTGRIVFFAPRGWSMGRPDRYLHDGVEVPSVTTVLDAAYPDGDRDGLLWWAEHLARRGRSWHDEREQRGRGGSYVHAIVEAYLQGKAPPAPTDALSEETYSDALTSAVAICQWISAQRLDPAIGLEHPLTCATYGGTADYVTCSPTTLTVRDWKTGRRPAIHKWRAQTAAYAALWTAAGAQREHTVLETIHCRLGTSDVKIDRCEGEAVIVAGTRWLAVLYAYRACL